jgi:hypothetical protein
MAKMYRVLKRSFIGLRLREVGETVSSDELVGKPGRNLELVDAGPPSRSIKASQPNSEASLA